ncbi:cationic peroxidase [Artemisia annua]|uniref:Cationic peroxidase n=1 Tax=Artemisia annua TaxID=35608 RepID=A0A2U1MKV5_ARTAN|nr:cationic peroxidase [Artemisia annua]
MTITKGLLWVREWLGQTKHCMKITGLKLIVDSYAKDLKMFYTEFAASMVKHGNAGVMEDGEISEKGRVIKES